jgi:lipoate-protein ligase A
MGFFAWEDVMRNNDWRLLDLKFSSYAAATPLISTLLKLKSEEKIPNTLALITFEKSSVCLFYYNDPEKEIDMEFCQQKDIEMGRRDTGGSPYWADPGTLIIFFWFNRKQVPDFPDTISEGYRFLIGASAQAISERFGIPAVYRPLNDLEVGARKLAGHTVTFLGDTCRWGCGPQVLKPRMELMSKALKVPPEKFADKEAKTVEARVTNFEELLGRPPSFEEVKQTYALALERTLKIKFQRGNLSPEEQQIIEKKNAEWFSEAWLMAMTEKRKFADHLPARFPRGEHVLKVPQGPLIRAIVLMDGEIIRNISLTGSVHCLPVQLVEEIEAGIRGLEGKEEVVRGVVQNFFNRPGVQVPNCSPHDFVQAIMSAVGAAKRRP